MHADEVTYYSGAVKPLQCLGDGWRLIKKDYWFYFGITFVAMLIGEAVPLWLLFGPMMCGMHVCFLRQQRGARVSFDDLFKGFEFFMPSLIATMVWVLVSFSMALCVFLLFGGIALGMAIGPPGPDHVWVVLLGMAGFYLALFGLILVINVMTIFVYPLIVDRNLSGLSAVGLSARAAWANLGGVLAVVLLEGLINAGGLMLCIVGVYFVLPLGFAMTALAYRQVFPEEHRRYHDDFDLAIEEREPTNPGDTGIRVLD